MLLNQRFEQFDRKPTIFTYNVLRAATRDFHPEMMLGGNCLGGVYVYKGMLPSGDTVSVKLLSNIKSAEALNEFTYEVALLTRMNHRNLVNLKADVAFMNIKVC